MTEFMEGVFIALQLMAWVWASVMNGDAGPDRVFAVLIGLSVAAAAAAVIPERRNHGRF